MYKNHHLEIPFHSWRIHYRIFLRTMCVKFTKIKCLMIWGLSMLLCLSKEDMGSLAWEQGQKLWKFTNSQELCGQGWRCTRLLPGTLASCIEVPGTESHLWIPSWSLLMCILGGSWWWPNYLGPCHPRERLGWSSWLLALIWPNLGCCSHLGHWRNEPAGGRLLSLHLPFK